MEKTFFLGTFTFGRNWHNSLYLERFGSLAYMDTLCVKNTEGFFHPVSFCRNFAQSLSVKLFTHVSETFKCTQTFKLTQTYLSRLLSWYYFIKAHWNYTRTLLSLWDFYEFPFCILNFKQILWLYSKGLNGLMILKVLLWHHCTAPFFHVCFVVTQRSSIYEKPVLNL